MTVATTRRRTLDLVARINVALGWSACEPERRADGSHTGSVIVRERAAEVLAQLAEHHGATEPAMGTKW